MLTRKSSKNQITLPVSLLEQLPESDYFEATVESGALVLRPVRVVPAVDIEQIRTRLAQAGVTEADVPKAVRWARSRQRRR